MILKHFNCSLCLTSFLSVWGLSTYYSPRPYYVLKMYSKWIGVIYELLWLKCPILEFICTRCSHNRIYTVVKNEFGRVIKGDCIVLQVWSYFYWNITRILNPNLAHIFQYVPQMSSNWTYYQIPWTT